MDLNDILRRSWEQRAEEIKLRQSYGEEAGLYGTEIEEGIEEEIDRLSDSVTKLRKEIEKKTSFLNDLRSVKGNKDGDLIEKTEAELRELVAEEEAASGSISSLRDRQKMYQGRRTLSAYGKDFRKKNLRPIIVWALFFVTGLFMVFYLERMVRAALTLDYRLLAANVWFLLLTGVVPFAVWAWATAFPEYRRYPVKFGVLRLCIVNLGVVAASQSQRALLYLADSFLLPGVAGSSSVSGAEAAAYVAAVTAFLGILVGVFLSYGLMKAMKNPVMDEELRYFRADRYVDMREDKEFMYDQRLVKRMDKAHSWHVTKMQDRFLHSLIDGPTGTGKTAIMMINAIRQDLDQYCYNLNHQKQAMFDLLREGKVRLECDMDDANFRADAFVPVYSGNERADAKLDADLKRIREVMSPCVVVAVGPNDGYTDQIYEMAKSRGIRNTYRIDPVRVRSGKLAGSLKEDFYGFNPLYVPDDVTPEERDILISSNAQNVTNTLNMLNKQTGSVDAYFEGVNSTQTMNISILMMLVWKDLHGVAPTLDAELDLLYDFKRIRRPLYRMVQMYGNYGRPIDGMDDLWDTAKYRTDEDAEREFEKLRRNREINCGPWQKVYDVFINTLLDKEKGDIQYERANGLRNQFEVIMIDERVRSILCSQKSIDFRKVLAEGGVVVYNFALELGENMAGTLGRFFTYAFSKAVLMRDTSKFLIPSFTYIDEFPTVLNSSMEEMFTLHRQYRNANTVAIQTNMQMEKSQQTKYFKVLLMSNTAQQYLFGRQSIQEMDEYQTLGGERVGAEVRTAKSRKPFATDERSYSENETVIYKKEARYSGTDIRYADFKELTVYAVDDGSPVRPFRADGDFITAYERKAPNLMWFDWGKYYHGSREGQREQPEQPYGEEIPEWKERVYLRSVPEEKGQPADGGEDSFVDDFL